MSIAVCQTEGLCQLSVPAFLLILQASVTQEKMSFRVWSYRGFSSERTQYLERRFAQVCMYVCVYVGVCISV